MKKTILAAASVGLTSFAIIAAARHTTVHAAIEYPQMKEGLWSIHMVTTSNPGNKVVDGTQKLCRSHAYDEYAHSLSVKRVGCSAITENAQGGGWTMEGDCTVQGSVMHVKSNIKSVDADHIHSETHSTMTPPMMGVAETTMVQDQTFVGACPAGVQPGDMTMANGMVMHLWKH